MNKRARICSKVDSIISEKDRSSYIGEDDFGSLVRGDHHLLPFEGFWYKAFRMLLAKGKITAVLKFLQCYTQAP
jgi:hypothetical protein